jgi:hypothetical protein
MPEPSRGATRRAIRLRKEHPLLSLLIKKKLHPTQIGPNHHDIPPLLLLPFLVYRISSHTYPIKIFLLQCLGCYH